MVRPHAATRGNVYDLGAAEEAMAAREGARVAGSSVMKLSENSSARITAQ